MSIVIDSSVVVAALADSGPHDEWAEEVLSSGDLQGPELLRAEATHIFRRLEKAKLITTPEANAAQEDLMQLNIELFPFEPFADRIWELRQNVTSYDAWYSPLPRRSSSRSPLWTNLFRDQKELPANS